MSAATLYYADPRDMPLVRLIASNSAKISRHIIIRVAPVRGPSLAGLPCIVLHDGRKIEGMLVAQFIQKLLEVKEEAKPASSVDIEDYQRSYLRDETVWSKDDAVEGDPTKRLTAYLAEHNAYKRDGPTKQNMSVASMSGEQQDSLMLQNYVDGLGVDNQSVEEDPLRVLERYKEQLVASGAEL